MSLAIVGDVSSGTPAMTRDAGAVGSGCSSGTLDPAVPNCFKVASFSAVAGFATNVSTIVLCCSALLFANSNASRLAQQSPASAAVGVIESSPAGPDAVVLAKNALNDSTDQLAKQTVADDLERGR